MKHQSFEKFYLTKVALGDCCGCAERVIDWNDIELAAREKRIKPMKKAPGIRLWPRWLSFLRRS